MNKNLLLKAIKNLGDIQTELNGIFYIEMEKDHKNFMERYLPILDKLCSAKTLLLYELTRFGEGESKED